jgi:hypothetical protein
LQNSAQASIRDSQYRDPEALLLPSYVGFLAAHRGALAFGFGLTFFSSVGQTFFVALFNRQIRDVYDLTSGEFGTIYAVASLTSAMLMIRAGTSPPPPSCCRRRPTC